MRGVVVDGGGWWCFNEYFISIFSLVFNGNIYFGLDVVINFIYLYLIFNMMNFI